MYYNGDMWAWLIKIGIDIDGALIDTLELRNIQGDWMETMNKWVYYRKKSTDDY